MPSRAVMATEGAALALRSLVERGLTLRLYVNDQTPSKFDTFETFEELNSFDYGAQGLIGLRWTFVEGEPVRAHYPLVEFKFGGFRGTIFGWYITSGRTLIGAGRFEDAPWKVVNVGDVISVEPTLLFGAIDGGN